MRTILLLFTLAALALAKPPESKGFLRADGLRDKIAERHKKLLAAEEYARKPREEKMLIQFMQGERRFEKKPLDGKLVVETVLEWDQVARNEPTEAGTRVLELLPFALEKRYARAVEIPKKPRYEASGVLVKQLNSEYLHIRISAINSLKKVYRTEHAFMYEPDMAEKERQDAIKKWRRFIRKQR